MKAGNSPPEVYLEIFSFRVLIVHQKITLPKPEPEAVLKPAHPTPPPLPDDFLPTISATTIFPDAPEIIPSAPPTQTSPATTKSRNWRPSPEAHQTPPTASQ